MRIPCAPSSERQSHAECRCISSNHRADRRRGSLGPGHGYRDRGSGIGVHERSHDEERGGCRCEAPQREHLQRCRLHLRHRIRAERVGLVDIGVAFEDDVHHGRLLGQWRALRPRPENLWRERRPARRRLVGSGKLRQRHGPLQHLVGGLRGALHHGPQLSAPLGAVRTPLDPPDLPTVWIGRSGRARSDGSG